MGKIIKKSVEKIIIKKQTFSLWMKWKFKIEFANDSFWPYKYKFQREDCYFNDWLEDRWTKIFPLKNKAFNNTEIFLETDDIIVAVWERWNLIEENKTFIDIINIKTEKKYRLFTKEVNLIFNSEDKIIINAEDKGIFKTIILDINSLRKIEKIEEEFQAFFKCVYNKKTDEWFVLDFTSSIPSEKDDEKKHKNWSFILQKIALYWAPEKFNREHYSVEIYNGTVDLWKESLI